MPSQVSLHSFDTLSVTSSFDLTRFQASAAKIAGSDCQCSRFGWGMPHAWAHPWWRWLALRGKTTSWLGVSSYLDRYTVIPYTWSFNVVHQCRISHLPHMPHWSTWTSKWWTSKTWCSIAEECDLSGPLHATKTWHALASLYWSFSDHDTSSGVNDQRLVKLKADVQKLDRLSRDPERCAPQGKKHNPIRSKNA